MVLVPTYVVQERRGNFSQKLLTLGRKSLLPCHSQEDGTASSWAVLESAYRLEEGIVPMDLSLAIIGLTGKDTKMSIPSRESANVLKSEMCGA